MAILSQPNRWVVQDLAATTVLTYAVQVNPAPLTVTPPAGEPVLGSVEFIITNQTRNPVLVTSIAFQIQIGAASSDLTGTTASIATALSDTNDWSIEKPSTITNGPAVYTVVPQTVTPYPLAAGTSLTVQFYNFTTVSDPGTTQIEIKELTAGGTGLNSVQITTFPAGFYFSDLIATVPNGGQLIPVAQVTRSTPITLLWNSSVADVASYRIYYTDPLHGQQSAVPTVFGEWVSQPLNVDTVFTLVVTTSTMGGTALSTALSVAVSVQNADIVVQSVSAVTAAVSGAFTVQGPISAASTITSVGAISGLGMAPIGGIILYYGDLHNTANWTSGGAGVAGTQYAGWQLCNGQQGSPDLRDKFVPGAGSNYAVGATGGADAITLSIGQLATHNHGGQTGGSAPYLNYQGVYYNSKGVSRGIMYNNSVSDPDGYRPNLLTTRGLPEIQVQSHGHGIPYQGNGEPHENRPQFFALAYLMKVV